MSIIPKVNNGDLMKNIRENTLNPMVDKVNEVDSIKAIAEGNTAALALLIEDVVDNGGKCKVDHRIFNYHATTTELSIPMTLEDNKFAVRAVLRTGDRKGEYIPATKMVYDRDTQVLTVTVGNLRDGQIMLEFWKLM